MRKTHHYGFRVRMWETNLLPKSAVIVIICKKIWRFHLARKTIPVSSSSTPRAVINRENLKRNEIFTFPTCLIYVRSDLCGAFAFAIWGFRRIKWDRRAAKTTAMARASSKSSKVLLILVLTLWLAGSDFNRKPMKRLRVSGYIGCAVQKIPTRCWDDFLRSTLRRKIAALMTFLTVKVMLNFANG